MKKLLFTMALGLHISAHAKLHGLEHLGERISLPRDMDSTNSNQNWQSKSLAQDNVLGAEVDKVYVDFGQPTNEIIVAVIDSGVDITHPDLDGKIWVNEGEIPNNGIDDDNNGFVDDYNGWNFLGSKEGFSKYEFTNENKNGFTVQRNTKAPQLLAADSVDTRFLRYLLEKQVQTNLSNKEREQLKELQEEIFLKREEALNSMTKYQEFYIEFMKKVNVLKGLGLKTLSKEEVAALDIDENNLDQIALKAEILDHLENGVTIERLESSIEKHKTDAYFIYNYLQDPVSLVTGDDKNNLEEIGYGNNDVIGPSAEHGTISAGVIAAIRDNEIGINGIASNVKIMPLRVLAKGDERDKDVANAIRYAVDNGARVINLSFGKNRSLHKSIVDKAISLAEKKGIIIVNSAGNDGSDNDLFMKYPNDLSLEKNRFDNMITVAANGPKLGVNLIPRFSNYGQHSVDILAPGVRIISLSTQNETTQSSGTSLSAPVVSGIIALMLGYKPDLSVKEIKDLLFQTVTRIPGQQLFNGKKSYLYEICRTGGIVNAHAAISAFMGPLPINTLASIF